MADAPKPWRLLVLGSLSLACESATLPGTASPSASASALAAGAGQEAQLRAAEQRRDSARVTKTHMHHRQAAVRRSAARALARIADARAVEGLAELLHDQDAAVVAWSAYGLGYACQGKEEKLVPKLTLRAASWVLDHGYAATGAETLAPLTPIAQALARCGSSDAERTLRAWLTEPTLAEEAALALGNLAGYRKRLDAASVVALLEAAAHPGQSLEHALYAFSRMAELDPTVQARLTEVAVPALEQPGLRRTFAIRALGSAGPAAVEPLKQVLSSGAHSPSDRAAASRALARLGRPGQVALQQALKSLVKHPVQPDWLLSASFTPLWASLLALELPLVDAKPVLEELAELPIVEPISAPVKRRLVSLRCRAAALLAGRASAARRLVQCDPDPKGREGMLGRLSALDRGPLTQGRLRSWLQLVASDDPVVRQAALRLLGTHPEIDNAYKLLADALNSNDPGTVVTAAQLLATKPQLAAPAVADNAGAQAPASEIIRAFRGKLQAPNSRGPVEVLTALMDAAGALQLLSEKPALEQHCRSDQPALRQHAERALHHLGEKQRRCSSYSPPEQVPREVLAARQLDPTVQLLVKTDVGDLTIELDTEWAPVAVQRIVDLVQANYFTEMPIHRVVPGFVVQFGDKAGDGFGHAGREPIRCETSPIPFGAYGVGMALAGRDTAASQVFVALDRFPRLDGNYAWVGRAGPEWQRVAPGDQILEITMRR